MSSTCVETEVPRPRWERAGTAALNRIAHSILFIRTGTTEAKSGMSSPALRGTQPRGYDMGILVGGEPGVNPGLARNRDVASCRC